MPSWSPSPSNAPPPAPGWRDRSQVVDGNSLAGPLSRFFAGDATMLVVRCATCGHEAPLAETVVEVDDVVFAVLCRSCTHTLFVLQPHPDGDVLRIEALAAVRLHG